MSLDFKKGVTVEKIDAQHGVVFGFAMVSKVDGEPFFDSQGDHITEEALLEASLHYMEGDRVAKEMHRGEPMGKVVFAFPLTTDIAKMLGIESRRTGLIIGMKPSGNVLKKFADGTYTGFSIGGSYVESIDHD
jgi:hypothetical protein